MIGSITDMLFGCPHRRLTRPITPVSKAGIPHGDTYVVCLDCGKQFQYDLKQMRMGKAIERSHEASVLDPEAPISPKRKLRYAIWISAPLALLAGIMLRAKKPASKEKPSLPAKQ